MTWEIFNEWLVDFNKDMKKKKRKILLILDNVSSHKPIKMSNIELMFLPKNTTSIAQPLDLGKFRFNELDFGSKITV